MSSTAPPNRYWIPHMDIHKRVITQELQYYLGPAATVRPFTREGEDGYLITTPGECLTDEQIDDICLKSKEIWDKQAEARSKANPDKQLKRPLHEPILMSKSIGDRPPLPLNRRTKDRRSRGARRPYDGRKGDSYPR